MYKKNGAAGMQYLLDSIQVDGQFRSVSGSQYMYNHGIATIALAEIYGESHSPTLRRKLELLIAVILKAQNKAGGWRYTPRPSDADVSVTVMQAVALRAAQEAGLAVPQVAIDRAAAYIATCYNADKGGFCYQPGGQPGFAGTAGGIYALQVLGRYDDPTVKTGSEFLLSHSKDTGGHYAYGSNYAAPAQYMIGGQTWRTWYELTSKNLLNTVQREGDLAYWKGADPGIIFHTAVFVTVLAMPYHFLPLYQR